MAKAVDGTDVGEAGIGEHVAAAPFLVPGTGRGEVGCESAGGGGVEAAVVVEGPDHRMPAGPQVVQPLPRHASGQSRVPDHRHRGAVTGESTGLGRPVRIRQGGRGVPVLHPVMRGLGPARITGQPARRSTSKPARRPVNSLCTYA